MSRRVVLVTGGAGFIGANLCRALLAVPALDEVRVLDDFSTGAASNLADLDVRVHTGSILDDLMLADAVDGCSHIVHLAAIPSVPRSIAAPLASHDANATGTLRVLEAARRHDVQHVIVASSSSVYGANPALPKTEDLACRPLSPYAVSKLAAEQYAMAYATCYRLPVLPLRFFNVFGPLQAAGHAYAAVVPAFVDAALARRPLRIFGDGTQSRDFTFVDSVTAVISDAIARDVTSEPLNLAFGTRTTLLELVAIIERVLGRSLEVMFDPPRSGDVQHSQADASRLRAAFPGVAPVPLEAGIASTVDWFRSARSDN